jgi:hypothetical protein
MEAMFITPIFPGRAYQVRFRGRTLTVLAAHPCDVIGVVLRAYGVFA